MYRHVSGLLFTSYCLTDYITYNHVSNRKKDSRYQNQLKSLFLRNANSKMNTSDLVEYFENMFLQLHIAINLTGQNI